ncbi:hypothetical protein Ciccas_012093, partial [Cichlidogyrus casuarinus]
RSVTDYSEDSDESIVRLDTDDETNQLVERLLGQLHNQPGLQDVVATVVRHIKAAAYKKEESLLTKYRQLSNELAAAKLASQHQATKIAGLISEKMALLSELKSQKQQNVQLADMVDGITPASDELLRDLRCDLDRKMNQVKQLQISNIGLLEQVQQLENRSKNLLLQLADEKQLVSDYASRNHVLFEQVDCDLLQIDSDARTHLQFSDVSHQDMHTCKSRKRAHPFYKRILLTNKNLLMKLRKRNGHIARLRLETRLLRAEMELRCEKQRMARERLAKLEQDLDQSNHTYSLENAAPELEKTKVLVARSTALQTQVQSLVRDNSSLSKQISVLQARNGKLRRQVEGQRGRLHSFQSSERAMNESMTQLLQMAQKMRSESIDLNGLTNSSLVKQIRSLFEQLVVQLDEQTAQEQQAKKETCRQKRRCAEQLERISTMELHIERMKQDYVVVQEKFSAAQAQFPRWQAQLDCATARIQVLLAEKRRLAEEKSKAVEELSSARVSEEKLAERSATKIETVKRQHFIEKHHAGMLEEKIESLMTMLAKISEAVSKGCLELANRLSEQENREEVDSVCSHESLAYATERAAQVLGLSRERVEQMLRKKSMKRDGDIQQVLNMYPSLIDLIRLPKSLATMVHTADVQIEKIKPGRYPRII